MSSIGFVKPAPTSCAQVRFTNATASCGLSPSARIFANSARRFTSGPSGISRPRYSG